MPVVEGLRRLGHDVLTVLEAGKADMAETDETVLAYACSESRSILTLNRKHFVRLHNERSEHEASSCARSTRISLVRHTGYMPLWRVRGI